MTLEQVYHRWLDLQPLSEEEDEGWDDSGGTASTVPGAGGFEKSG